MCWVAVPCVAAPIPSGYCIDVSLARLELNLKGGYCLDRSRNLSDTRLTVCLEVAARVFAFIDSANIMDRQ